MAKKNLNNLLFAELDNEQPDEQVICDLIAKGANINAVNSLGSVIINAISNRLNLKYIQLLIDLGANLNYAEEGFNCLYDASLTMRPDLVEMLLKTGTNPNCVSQDFNESLLEWAEFDQWYEATKYNNWFEAVENKGEAKTMEKIVVLLKQYGAKPTEELKADKPEIFINISSIYPTGLITATGNLEIDYVQSADKNLIDNFKKWHLDHPDKWANYKIKNRKITSFPDLKLFRKQNEIGSKLAQRIKKLVGKEMNIKYFYATPEGFKTSRHRSVESLVMG